MKAIKYIILPVSAYFKLIWVFLQPIIEGYKELYNWTYQDNNHDQVKGRKNKT